MLGKVTSPALVFEEGPILMMYASALYVWSVRGEDTSM